MNRTKNPYWYFISPVSYLLGIFGALMIGIALCNNGWALIYSGGVGLILLIFSILLAASDETMRRQIK